MAKNIFFLIFLITPFYSQAETLSTGQQSFELHGYIRTGVGMSEAGETQAKFQAPGTRASYRLGNEPDASVELGVNYRYEMNEPEFNNAHIQGVFLLEGYKTHGESNDLGLSNLAQGYLSFNQFLNSETKLWLGRRYYDRKDIHIMDHIWLNPGKNSQAGVGAEDITANVGKINIAVFRYEDNFTISGIPYLINSTNLDVRWHDLPFGSNSKFTLWAGLTNRHKLKALSYDDQSGFGLGGWLDKKTVNATNTTAIIYQTGSSITQGDNNPNPVREDAGWDLDKATSLEINNTLTYELLPDYSVQWALMFRQEDHGLAGSSTFSWYSTGVRPIFYFSKHVNFALEGSVDYVDDKINSRSGSLSKLTLALQVSADRGFYNRPVLRLFVTLADWDNEFKGLVGSAPGNAPYSDDTQGWTAGAQTEVWW